MDKPQGLIDLEFRMRRAGLTLLYLAIFAVVWAMIRYAQPAIEFMLTVLSPFIVAMLIAYIFNPIVTWLQKRFKLGRIGGVVITYIIILSITIGFFALLIPILYEQLRTGITSLVANFPKVVDKATNWLALRVSPEEMAQAKDFIRNNLNVGAISGRAGNVTEGALDTTKLITKIIGTALSVVIGGLAFVAFVVVICFYFLLDYRNMEHVARVLLPEDTESKVFHIWNKIDKALGGYLRGQLIVATTIGILYTVVLSFMGMKQYAVLIGFLAGFGNMIPYTGPILGGVPAGLWILFGDTYDTSQEKLFGVLGIIALSIFAQTLDGLFLQPRIVGKNAELHPLLVMLALLVGAQFGLGGMIIAVPLAVMARVAVKELWWDPLEQQEYENKRLAAVAKSGMSSVPVDAVSGSVIVRNGTPATVTEVMQRESAQRIDLPDEDASAEISNTSPGTDAPRKKRRRRRRN